MLPNATTAYRVTLPNGTTFYAANVIVLTPPRAEADAQSLPEGVCLYLMDTNTVLNGYAFYGTKPREGGTRDRMHVRFYEPVSQQFAPRPVVFNRVGRDQVEGDDDSPVEFTDAELEDESLIQTMMVAALARPDMDANLENKIQRGFVRLSS